MRSLLGAVRPACSAFGLIEIVVAAVILCLVIAGVIDLLNVSGRLGRQETELMTLQLDAQRALAQFVRELQEGMELILPQPGNTLPYALVRDKLNRVATYYVVTTPRPGVLDLKRDLVGPSGRTSATLLGGVARLTFSSLSDGAVRVHLTLAGNDRQYALYTQIRLHNRDAARF